MDDWGARAAFALLCRAFDNPSTPDRVITCSQSSIVNHQFS